MQGSRWAGTTAARHGARHRRTVCAVCLATTLPLGLAWRLAPLGLPPFAFKYGGSALWAVAVYWVWAFLLPRTRATRLAELAALTALVVELCKLIDWRPLGRFRETLAGKLLLGRYFTVGAIVAYWLAIGIVALIDCRFAAAGKGAAGRH